MFYKKGSSPLMESRIKGTSRRLDAENSLRFSGDKRNDIGTRQVLSQWLLLLQIRLQVRLIWYQSSENIYFYQSGFFIHLTRWNCFFKKKIKCRAIWCVSFEKHL